MDSVAGQLLPFINIQGTIPAGWAPANGASFSGFGTLTAVLGTTTLPNVTPVGPLPWIVNELGSYPENMVGMIGEVRLWPGPLTPQNWQVCDGSLLPINEQMAPLFTVIGTLYGGDGSRTFAVPNLPAPSGLRYLIATEGVFPPEQSDVPPVDYFLGSFTLFAGSYPPGGFAPLTQALTLYINNFVALFAAVGTTFGGDGQATFGLPQLAPLNGVQWVTPLFGVYPTGL